MEDPYYSLTVNYTKRIAQNIIPGTFDAGINSALSIDQGDGIARPPSFTSIGLEYSKSGKIGKVQRLDHSFARINSFVNGETQKV